ncbi:MAG: penicillin-binding protein 2 [Ignavibacteriae bacterium]|nr:penicillin-binding protein 2 [Ignavibacteriota bacterium]
MPAVDDIQIYSKRRVLYVVVILAFMVFFARLYQLQMIYQDEYGKKSEENSVRIITKDPVRGYIYDRNWRLIVDNRPAFTVTIMPYEFDRHAIDYLAGLLRLEPQYIRDRLKKGSAYSLFAPVKISRDIDFRMLSALEEQREWFPGVDYQVESKRYYVTSARASHILGYTKEISESQMKTLGDEYTQGDVVGSAGLEAQYERALRGKKGSEFSTVNVRGQVVGSFDNGRSDIQAVDGNDLLLTMDFDLQALAESLMTDQRGAIVALDPQNGGVLALVSKPDYDLSLFSGVTPPGVWRRLNADVSRPLFNRATLTRYPPGSTYKMVLAVAALERGIIKPSSRIQCGGAIQLGPKVFKDLHVHGSVNMTEAIQKSCNVYFYQLMLKTGLDIWAEYGAMFGFGRVTGIDIGEENPGLLPTTDFMNKRYGPSGWTRGFLPSLGIGQGELGVTPIQMACYAMLLANKGTFHEPHAVAAVIDKSHRVTHDVTFESRTLPISQETWDIVREGMRRVVQEPGGTGSTARIKGIQSGGKTGTSQNPHGKDHAWYVGFAPFDNPKIAIAVMVENAGFGGSYAAPIAGMCIEQYIHGRLIRFDTRPEVKPVPVVDTTSTRRALPQAGIVQDQSAGGTQN